jgi:heme exporter protein D
MTPQFNTWSEFFAMGGYAPFVFGAWGLSVAVIIGLIVRVIIHGRHQKARLAALRSETGESPTP